MIHKTYLYIVDSYKSWYRCCLLITHFGSVNQTGSKCRQSIAWKLSLFSLCGKTGLRQFQAIVVTWDNTSCLLGTDIEMLYNKQHSIPAIYIPLHLYNQFYNQFLLICS